MYFINKGDVVSFLKFLKREKKEDNFDELDLPPAPPPLEGKGEFGSYDFDEKLPELPEFPEFEEQDASATGGLPKFDFPKEESMPSPDEEEMPKFPSFQEENTNIPPISAPASIPQPMPQTIQQMTSPIQEKAEPEPEDTYPRMGRRLFSHEKIILREKPNVKTIYVRIDRFKATLGSINMVRSDLRKSEEALSKLENIKIAKDKSFDKLRYSLDDLQKKLIFVDKILFKGDGN